MSKVRRWEHTGPKYYRLFERNAMNRWHCIDSTRSWFFIAWWRIRYRRLTLDD